MSQGYGKDPGAKGAGKAGGGKKGWSPNGFSGTCYNCGEVGHSAKWCTKGKGGKMSWVGGGWEQDWGGSGNGETDAAATHIPTLTSGLKPKKPIELPERYKALEEDEEEQEDDDEPGNMFKDADPDSRADKLCPCGAIRNWWQNRREATCCFA